MTAVELPFFFFTLALLTLLPSALPVTFLCFITRFNCSSEHSVPINSTTPVFMDTSQLFVEPRVKHELNVCTTMRNKEVLSKVGGGRKKEKKWKKTRGRNTHTWHSRDKCEMQFSSYGIALISTVAPSGFSTARLNPPNTPTDLLKYSFCIAFSLASQVCCCVFLWLENGKCFG